MKYYCTVCGYVYDEERGLLEKNIQPGTKFNDLPDDFTCPRCHQSIYNHFVLFTPENKK